MSRDADVVRLREQLGDSTSLWAGPRGVRRDAGGWTAFSGAASVDYNVAFCAAAGGALDRGIERVLEARVPAVVMVAGAALGEVQRLVARSWVCVGATPVMTRAVVADVAAPPAGHARRLDGEDELARARALVADTFEIDVELARVALPDPAGGHSVWGDFDGHGTLRACLALVPVEESVVVWSMATDAGARGRGHGRAALEAALDDAARAGREQALLYASPDGEPFYRRLGFVERERWQIWSRPRWVLGRA